MDMPRPTAAPRSVVSIFPALVLLALALGFMVWAQQYSETARRFPTIVTVTMALLALIDAWSRTRLPGHGAIIAFWGAGFGNREMQTVPPFSQELALIGWVLACFAGIAIFGILIAAPLFCLAYVWLRAGRSLTMALTVGAAVLCFEYAVFEWTLDYTLYRGLLFSSGGLSRW